MIHDGCKGLICLFSSTSSLGHRRQLNYLANQVATACHGVKDITAEFFRRLLVDNLRPVLPWPEGNGGTPDLATLHEP